MSVMNATSGRRVFLGFIYAGAIGVLIQKWTTPINTVTTISSFALPIYITTDYLARSESWDILSSELGNFGLILLTLLEVTGLFALAVFAKSMITSNGLNINLYQAWPIYVFGIMNFLGNFVNIVYIRTLKPIDYAAICICGDMSYELETEDDIIVWQARLTEFAEMGKSKTIDHAIDCKIQVQEMESFSHENWWRMTRSIVKQKWYEGLSTFAMLIERLYYQFFGLHFLFLNAIFCYFMIFRSGTLKAFLSSLEFHVLGIKLDTVSLIVTLLIFAALFYLIKSLYELARAKYEGLASRDDIFNDRELEDFSNYEKYLSSFRHSHCTRFVDLLGNLSIVLAFTLFLSCISTSNVIILFLSQSFFVSFSVLAFSAEEQ